MSFSDLIRDSDKQIRQARSLEDFRRCLESFTARIGLQYFSLTHHLDFRCAPADALHLHNYPQEWAQRHDAQALGSQDPVHRASWLRGGGFLWTDIDQFMQLSAADKGIFRDAEKIGIGNGYTVPYNIPGDYRGSCSFAALPGFAISDEQRMACELMGRLAFDHVNLTARCRAPKSDSSPTLTDRQRQILMVLASGETEASAGNRLSLSPHTVDQHLKLARKRFRVSSTLSLFARALIQGQIDRTELSKIVTR